MSKHNNGFLEKVIEEYGDDILLKKYDKNEVPVISTGSLSIDVSTGIGGVPMGRVTEIYGPEGGGKTTLCLQIAKNGLELGYKVLYVDVENSLDFGYTQDILGNYDEEKFIVVQPGSGEDALEIAETGIDSDFKVVIFDSIAALSPEKELEDPFDKDHVGLTPRLAAKFLRRQMNNITKKEVAVVVTNQIRANIGSYLAGDLTTPAGFALKHYTSLRIFMVQLGASKAIIDDDENELGRYVKFIIKKNKLGVPYRTANTNIMYGKGTDYYRDVLGFASLLGIVKTRGSYYVFEEETIGLGTIKSMTALGENKELLDRIVKSCYNVIGIEPPIYGLKEKPQETEDGENT